jgi:hypothetical protein
MASWTSTTSRRSGRRSAARRHGRRTDTRHPAADGGPETRSHRPAACARWPVAAGPTSPGGGRRGWRRRSRDRRSGDAPALRPVDPRQKLRRSVAIQNHMPRRRPRHRMHRRRPGTKRGKPRPLHPVDPGQRTAAHPPDKAADIQNAEGGGHCHALPSCLASLGPVSGSLRRAALHHEVMQIVFQIAAQFVAGKAEGQGGLKETGLRPAIEALAGRSGGHRPARSR